MPSCKLESRSDSGLFHSASLRFQRGDEEKMNWVSVCAVCFLHFFFEIASFIFQNSQQLESWQLHKEKSQPMGKVPIILSTIGAVHAGRFCLAEHKVLGHTVTLICTRLQTHGKRWRGQRTKTYKKRAAETCAGHPPVFPSPRQPAGMARTHTTRARFCAC